MTTAGKPKAQDERRAGRPRGDNPRQRHEPATRSAPRVKKPKHKKGKRRFNGLQLMTPPSAGVAPPGYYMLFVLDKKGVPSVAKWVQLEADGGARRPEEAAAVRTTAEAA